MYGFWSKTCCVSEFVSSYFVAAAAAGCRWLPARSNVIISGSDKVSYGAISEYTTQYTI